METKSTN